MTDFFSLLNEPRRPWLDSDALKEKFLALSASVHPDRVHHLSAVEREQAHQRYTDLNTGFNCLREPRLRLKHLLELELGKKPSDLTQVPEDLMTVFFEIGRTMREVDAFLTEKSGATSPLLKVQLFERNMEMTDILNNLKQQLSSRRDALMDRLRELDLSWSQPAAPNVLARLENVYRLISYHDRWIAQVSERLSLLAL